MERSYIMKIGIMQPYFFPYLGYWQLIKAVDKYVIYDDVNFIKNGWINRNNILLGGKKHLLTLPLEGASSYIPINETKITSNDKLKGKLVKTIELAYKKAPYFDHVFPIVCGTILHKSNNIAHALTYSIREICRYLNIETDIIVSSELRKDDTLAAQDKVIHICHLLEGTRYFNAIGGQELYSKEAFQKNHLELYLIKMKEVEYVQFGNDFIPSLSIMDVLMFNSPHDTAAMLEEYELI